MSPELDRVWRWIKRPIEILTIGYTLLHVVTLLGIVFVPWSFTGSRTLQGYIAGGAILGGVLSFFFTSNAWIGVGKDRRIRRRNWYLIGALASYVLAIIGPIVISQPQLAARFGAVRDLRSLLIDSIKSLEFLMFFGGILTSYFAIGAICLNSPSLARPRPGGVVR
jgi:hypothetical protein